MKSIRCLAVLMLVLLPNKLPGQLLYSKNYVPVTYVDLPKKIEAAKRASVSIELLDYSTKKLNTIGSGFLVQKDTSVYVITNLHVVNSVVTNQVALVGINRKNQKHHFTITKIIPDKAHDLVVLQMGNELLLQGKPIDTTLTNPANYTISMFETNEKIIEGTGVIIIGYPLGLGSEYLGNKPVSRVGIIAQEPNLQTNTFIVDGIASHGNSGSPVINAENLKLVGIVSSFKPDRIELYDSDLNLRASLPYNSGLTICFTAEIIKKLIP